VKKLLVALLAALALTASAADVTFQWTPSATDPGDGSVVRVYSDPGLTQLQGEVEVVGVANTTTVTLNGGTHYVTVYAWANVQNPDGSTVRIESEASNVLHVKVAGKSTNIKVVPPTAQ